MQSLVPRFGIFLVLLIAFSQPVLSQDTKVNADFKLAINLFNDGLYDLASEQLKQFIASYPSSSEATDARFYLGLAELKLTLFDNARTTFQSFALTYQDNPKAPEAWWHVGEAYAAMKNYKEAALAFERVKSFHPKSKTAPSALVEASKYFRLAGQPDDARRVLRIVLQEYSSSTAALSARAELGRMYFEEGNLERAQNELKRVIDGDPSPEARTQALLILGDIYRSLGKSEQARSAYTEILAKNKSATIQQTVYVNLAKMLAAEGKNAEAIDQFKKALARKTDVDTELVQQGLIGAGDAYAALGDYTNAMQYYENFIDAYPRDEQAPSILWKVAQVAAHDKSFRTSNEACTKIIRSDASALMKRRAQVKLALNAFDQKNAAQAVLAYTTFLDQYPDDPAAPEIVFRIASITEHDLHDSRKAASYYELLLTRYPHSPFVDDASFAAGRCYEQQKEFNRAIQFYRQLVAAYPASDFAGRAVERIARIEVFEVKDKDAGLEKLALLIGDVVADKDKIGLAFKLGEIYFNDLKNYSAAVQQYTNAINSGMSDDRFVDALFKRAQAYEYLSWKDRSYTQKAVESYRTFLQSYPDDPRTNDGWLAVFNLTATSLETAKHTYSSILDRDPHFAHRDTMLLQIARLQESTGDKQSALASYAAIARDFSASPSASEARFHMIDLWIAEGNTDSAFASGDTFLRLFPHSPYSPELAVRLAELALKNGNPARAIQLYRKVTDEFPYASAAAGAMTSLAGAYADAREFDEAIALYRDLYEESAGNPLLADKAGYPFLLALGKIYYADGNQTEAKKYLFRYIAQHPSGVAAGDAYNTLGMIYRAEGSVDAAASYFRQANEVAPATASTREIADLLYQNGNFDDAFAQYSRLAGRAETDADRKYFQSRIALCRYQLDDIPGGDKLVAQFTKTYEATDTDLASFELEKARCYFRKSDYAKAKNIFEHIDDKYDDTPSEPEAKYWLGKILEVGNKPKEAAEQFKALLKRSPQPEIAAKAYLSLGNIYYNSEQWDESIQNYRRIVDDPQADPTVLPYAMSNLIETYEAAGIFDAALALTRKYLEHYPNNEDSFDKRIKIGILYQRLGYNDQAIMQLQGLLDQAGSDLEGEIRYYIAEANFNKGDYQQAILDFLKVPYLVTKKGKLDWTANSLYMAGQSYEKLGRYDQALTMYQQIVDRSGIDETFKAAAKKEIDRVKLVLQKSSN